MMNVIPVILSVPGRDTSALRKSLSSVFEETILYVDYSGEGAAVATRNAILLTQQVAADHHVLFCEDDVEMHPSFRTVLRTFMFPEHVGVVSFCDMREMPEGHKAGVYTRSAMGCDQNGWWGNQALLIHCETVKMLCNADWFDIWIQNSSPLQAHRALYHDDGANCSDIRMSMLVHELGGDRSQYAVNVPSLFRHVGHRSRCFRGRLPELGERETKNWAGNPWIDLPLEPDYLVRSAAAEAQNPNMADYGWRY
jgi:hypothetical protein